jgi:hypothetical protein
MTELLWYCPNRKSENDRMEAVLGRKQYWFLGERKRKLIAICIDCWQEMDLVGIV